MTIVSTLISSPIVDKHRVATTDDELIEDVDPVAPDIDLLALNVVIDISLRRSERACRPAISDDYIVYLQEHMSMMWGCIKSNYLERSHC